jgi:DNA repair exonuclease SbcCD ATPase subunit
VFNIDKNLDVRLDLRYPGEFNYYTLSMGERQRIDLSMSFAWRKLASIKNSINTNLLILDETFDASIDMDGVDDLLIILDDLKKNGVNVFVISHKGGLEDKLRSTVRVEKQNQFSRFVFNKKD